MTRNKHHDTLKPIAGGNAGGSFGGGGGGMAPGNANVVAFDQATLDKSGALLTVSVNVTQNHLYQVIGYIQCVYNNYTDSYVGQVVRRHSNDPDLLIGYGRSQGWDSIYYSAINMCVVDLADHTGVYVYELQLPKYDAGVVCQKYNLTVMDLGPRP